MPEGMTVFVENMPGESLFLIRQGAIKISRMLAEGDEKTLVILGAEEIFGEMAILDAAPRSATARVAEEARLLSIRKADYEVLCEQNPRLALKLTRNIVRVFSRRIEKTRMIQGIVVLVHGKPADLPATRYAAILRQVVSTCGPQPAIFDSASFS
jgi:CRP-like cAMP-binding protein